MKEVNEERKDNPEELLNAREVESYGDTGISSYDAKVPGFLKWTYGILPIWGIGTWLIFWNGSVGMFDRGYWKELQIAANTTFPIENQNMISKKMSRDSHEEHDFPENKRLP